MRIGLLSEAAKFKAQSSSVESSAGSNTQFQNMGNLSDVTVMFRSTTAHFAKCALRFTARLVPLRS
jgi:hypothetical protein